MAPSTPPPPPPGPPPPPPPPALSPAKAARPAYAAQPAAGQPTQTSAPAAANATQDTHALQCPASPPRSVPGSSAAAPAQSSLDAAVASTGCPQPIDQPMKMTGANSAPNTTPAARTRPPPPPVPPPPPTFSPLATPTLGRTSKAPPTRSPAHPTASPAHAPPPPPPGPPPLSPFADASPAPKAGARTPPPPPPPLPPSSLGARTPLTPPPPPLPMPLSRGARTPVATPASHMGTPFPGPSDTGSFVVPTPEEQETLLGLVPTGEKRKHVHLKPAKDGFWSSPLLARVALLCQGPPQDDVDGQGHALQPFAHLFTTPINSTPLTRQTGTQKDTGSHTLTFIAEEKAANNIMIALHGKRVQGEVVCAGWLGDGLLRLDTAPHAGEDDTSAHMTDDIRVMKARRVDVDMLSRVLNVADKHTDEIERLATHIRTHPQDLTRLADADKYLYELSRVPHLRERIEVMQLLHRLSEELHTKYERADKLTSVCLWLRYHPAWLMLLLHLLRAANEQNIGFKVHRGFKLESLHVFASLTNKQGVTFLDWVLERMRMNDPRDVEEVLCLYPLVSDAQTINLSQLKADVETMQQDLEKAKTLRDALTDVPHPPTQGVSCGSVSSQPCDDPPSPLSVCDLGTGATEAPACDPVQSLSVTLDTWQDKVDETLGAIDLAHRAVVKLGRWWCENINDTWDGRAMLKQIQQFLASVDECQRVYKEAVKLREHELKREQKRLAAEQKRLALSRQNSVAKAAGTHSAAQARGPGPHSQTPPPPSHPRDVCHRDQSAPCSRPASSPEFSLELRSFRLRPTPQHSRRQSELGDGDTVGSLTPPASRRQSLASDCPALGLFQRLGSNGGGTGASTPATLCTPRTEGQGDGALCTPRSEVCGEGVVYTPRTDGLVRGMIGSPVDGVSSPQCHHDASPVQSPAEPANGRFPALRSPQQHGGLTEALSGVGLPAMGSPCAPDGAAGPASGDASPVTLTPRQQRASTVSPSLPGGPGPQMSAEGVSTSPVHVTPRQQRMGTSGPHNGSHNESVPDTPPTLTPCGRPSECDYSDCLRASITTLTQSPGLVSDSVRPTEPASTLTLTVTPSQGRGHAACEAQGQGVLPTCTGLRGTEGGHASEESVSITLNPLHGPTYGPDANTGPTAEGGLATGLTTQGGDGSCGHQQPAAADTDVCEQAPLVSPRSEAEPSADTHTHSVCVLRELVSPPVQCEAPCGPHVTPPCEQGGSPPHAASGHQPASAKLPDAVTGLPAAPVQCEGDVSSLGDATEACGTQCEHTGSTTHAGSEHSQAREALTGVVTDSPAIPGEHADSPAQASRCESPASQGAASVDAATGIVSLCVSVDTTACDTAPQGSLTQVGQAGSGEPQAAASESVQDEAAKVLLPDAGAQLPVGASAGACGVRAGEEDPCSVGLSYGSSTGCWVASPTHEHMQAAGLLREEASTPVTLTTHTTTTITHYDNPVSTPMTLSHTNTTATHYDNPVYQVDSPTADQCMQPCPFTTPPHTQRSDGSSMGSDMLLPTPPTALLTPYQHPTHTDTHNTTHTDLCDQTSSRTTDCDVGMCGETGQSSLQGTVLEQGGVGVSETPFELLCKQVERVACESGAAAVVPAGLTLSLSSECTSPPQATASTASVEGGDSKGDVRVCDNDAAAVSRPASSPARVLADMSTVAPASTVPATDATGAAAASAVRADSTPVAAEQQAGSAEAACAAARTTPGPASPWCAAWSPAPPSGPWVHTIAPQGTLTWAGVHSWHKHPPSHHTSMGSGLGMGVGYTATQPHSSTPHEARSGAHSAGAHSVYTSVGQSACTSVGHTTPGSSARSPSAPRAPKHRTPINRCSVAMQRAMVLTVQMSGDEPSATKPYSESRSRESRSREPRSRDERVPVGLTELQTEPQDISFAPHPSPVGDEPVLHNSPVEAAHTGTVGAHSSPAGAQTGAHTGSVGAHASPSDVRTGPLVAAHTSPVRTHSSPVVGACTSPVGEEPMQPASGVCAPIGSPANATQEPGTDASLGSPSPPAMHTTPHVRTAGVATHSSSLRTLSPSLLAGVLRTPLDLCGPVREPLWLNTSGIRGGGVGGRTGESGQWESDESEPRVARVLDEGVRESDESVSEGPSTSQITPQITLLSHRLNSEDVSTSP